VYSRLVSILSRTSSGYHGVSISYGPDNPSSLDNPPDQIQRKQHQDDDDEDGDDGHGSLPSGSPDRIAKLLFAPPALPVRYQASNTPELSKGAATAPAALFGVF
jgi:hypothetical protein